MHLQPIPAPMVEANWDRVARYVADACIKGPIRQAPEDLREACLERLNQLWIIESDAGEARAVFITGIRDGVCEWSVVAGVEMHEWKHLEKTVEHWAKLNGCVAMRSLARKGWLRRAPDYDVKGVILEKDL